jgi:hypothetical protein
LLQPKQANQILISFIASLLSVSFIMILWKQKCFYIRE